MGVEEGNRLNYSLANALRLLEKSNIQQLLSIFCVPRHVVLHIDPPLCILTKLLQGNMQLSYQFL